MGLELWKPEREQLKRMTDQLMDSRMGSDWRTFWNPDDEMYRLTAMIRREDCCFLMTAGELCFRGTGPWAGTMTEELYRDAWGTALMDAGREMLKSYIANRRCTLKGPGLNGVPNEVMKGLYQALEGWRIGIEINDCYVLTPDKSFGGWLEPAGETDNERTCDAGGSCRPGVGCQFCMKRNVYGSHDR